MRDPNRIPIIISKLQSLWEKNPDLRLTQLLWTVAKCQYVFFFVEDDYIEKTIDLMLTKPRIEQ